jgi:hypothetical protein
MANLIMIKTTPLWVWLLLAFLIYRGAKALGPSTVTPWRMLLLPVIFFVWAFMGILSGLQDVSIALTTFTAALAAGGVLGWQLVRRQPGVKLDPDSGLVRRPGSSIPLVLICIGFSLKYTLSVFLARRPELGGMSGFCALYGALSGAVDGAFWGVTTTQFARALHCDGADSSSVKRLAPALFSGRTGAANRSQDRLRHRSHGKEPRC